MALYLRDIEHTGNKDIDFLFHNSATTIMPVDGGNTYTWSFILLDTAPTYENHGGIISKPFQDYMRYATQQMSNIINVNFVEIDGTKNPPGDIQVYSPAYKQDYEGVIEKSFSSSIVGLQYKDWGRAELIYNWNTAGHELAHLMGLSHPYKWIDGKKVYDSHYENYNKIDTLMSYNDTSYFGNRTLVFDDAGNNIAVAYNRTYGIHDILVLQYIQGANNNYNSGDTIYTYNPNDLNFFETIWDGGGNDTIDISAFSNGAELNLNGGTRSSIYKEMSAVQETLNAYNGKNAIGIAYGANIENANGTQGNDVIYGNELNNIINGNQGNDTLYGGDGDDRLSGGSGTNVLYGGAGNDYLTSHGKDTLYGGEGNDRYGIYGTESVRIVEGINDGIDSVNIYTKGVTNFVAAENIENVILDTSLTYNSSITGNDLDNQILGNNGDNILNGRKGNDRLQGYKGSDTYIFSKGDGQDSISESPNDKVSVTDKDILLFTDISSSQLWFIKTSYKGLESLNIKVLGTTDQISIDNWYSDNAKLEQIKTQDGVILSIAQIEALVDIMAKQAIPTGSSSRVINDYLIQTGANSNQYTNTIYGDAQNNIINGGAGDDTIYGGAGNDTISGGAGINILIGGAGNDTFISTGNDQLFGGDGDDTYEIYGPEIPTIIEDVNSGHDRIILNVSKAIDFVMPDNIEDLNQNIYQTAGINIEGNSLNNFINGNNGNNILIGGKGNDALQGYRGSDTYIFNKGDGKDTIYEYNNNNVPVTDTDILLFKDISANQLWFTKKTSWGITSLFIKVLGTADEIGIDGWYSNNAKLEQIKTQDGIVLSITQVEALVDIMATKTVPVGNSSSVISDYLAQTHVIYGTEGDDTLTSHTIASTLYGGAGNDKLISKGDDKLYGGAGNDIYEVVYGSNVQIIEEQNSGIDTIRLFATGPINYIMSDNVESIELANVLNRYDTQITGNALDNFIHGDNGNNVFIGGKGNDVFWAVGGSDTYIFSKGDGQDIIKDYNASADDVDVLLFTDISAKQLWFTKDLDQGIGSLTIKVLGTTDQILVNKWYGLKSNNGVDYDGTKLEQIKTQDGTVLTSKQVEALADIMSTQTMPTGSHSTIIDDYLAQASIMAA
ncbi:calcium-binding protein [Limnobaculum parvum]|uniref:Haemolysin-type calcium binding-related domain-containing protein n=1 Tax=Limnobaculum parvum TaxID=2172103 RepID=A0A2Y9U110_9GAMM|nr:calcium-binding protein [Limnobaculum parvum]AWH89319.1 hypothetical protein HYN51_12635 [Limnobaculum parvum]